MPSSSESALNGLLPFARSSSSDSPSPSLSSGVTLPVTIDPQPWPVSPRPMLSTIAPMPHLTFAPTSVVATAAMITETIRSAPRSSAAV